MRLNFISHLKNLKIFLFIAGWLMMQCIGRSEIPTGNWAFSGKIQDSIGSGREYITTYTVAGHYSNGCFILDITPVNKLEATAESVGWDGKLLCDIQRWSPSPKNGAPRTNAFAFVEPGVFSHYASYCCSPVLMALADSNQLLNLEQKKSPVIIGARRIYAEENNTYKIAYPRTNSNSTEIDAFCPGIQPGPSGLEPIPGFEKGFTRWKFKSSIESTNELDGSWKLTLKYSEFAARLLKPANDRQQQTRSVNAEILFQPEARQPSSFRPLIIEQQLPVQDNSKRNDLLPWTKGQFDWRCDYVFKNQQWDFPTNYINAEASNTIVVFGLSHGLPKELSAWVNTSKYQHAYPLVGRRRILIICGLVGISTISAALFWFAARSGKTTKTK
jgi:hypothetical protein